MLRTARRDFRVERMPGALVYEVRGVLNAAEQALEGSVSGDMDDPHRQVNLLALGAMQRSLAIPAFRQLCEQLGH